jgi:hypothetical protein
LAGTGTILGVRRGRERGVAGRPEVLTRPPARAPSPGLRTTPDVRRILQLQRLIGNQAVQRYVIVKEGDHRTSWKGEHGPLRVSDDGLMAVKHREGAPRDTTDYQAFYATPEVLASSRAALKQVGSALDLTPSSTSMQGRAPGDDKAPKRTLFKAAVENKDLKRTGKGAFFFNACTMNFENLLGVLRSTAADANSVERTRELVTRMEGSFDHQQKRIETGPHLSVALRTAREISTGAKSKAAYAKLEESIRQQVSAEYGVNEFALPDVGEGWGIMQGGAGGAPSAGLHFAPVIAASGGERGSTVPIGPTWYFRMFGSVKTTKKGVEDQSFWGEAKKHESKEFGDRPFVATIGSEKQMQVQDISTFEEMLSEYRKLLGERHPDTLRVATNLARTLREQGRAGEADTLEAEFSFQ